VGGRRNFAYKDEQVVGGVYKLNKKFGGEREKKEVMSLERKSG